MPQLLLISSDAYIIETVQSLSDYAVIHIPEITAENHAEILAKMAEVVIVLIDTVAVLDFNFYRKITVEWRYEVAPIPVLLLIAENELDSFAYYEYFEYRLIDFLTKSFSATLLKHRISQSLRQQKHEIEKFTEYVGAMEYDLKQAQASISNYILLLKIAGEQKIFDAETLQQIIQSHFQCLAETAKMMERYRNLAYLEANNLRISLKKEDIKPILQKNIAVIEQHIVGREQQLIIEIPDNLPFVSVNEYFMDTVFYELLLNATKFTDYGGTISIRAMHHDNVVYVIVQDTGCGIRSKDLPHIFNYSYTGLKLTRHIIEKHGGRIWIESEVNKGTTVHFTLPVAAEAMA